MAVGVVHSAVTQHVVKHDGKDAWVDPLFRWRVVTCAWPFVVL